MKSVNIVNSPAFLTISPALHSEMLFSWVFEELLLLTESDPISECACTFGCPSPCKHELTCMNGFLLFGNERKLSSFGIAWE